MDPTQTPQTDLDPEIPVRYPAGPLSKEIPRYWYGGDAFASHFMDALSSTFPFGEAFFVRAVLRYRDRIDDPALQRRIRGFAGQEGQHRRVHEQHVRMLIEQGYPAIETRNRFVDRIARWHNRRLPLLSLTMTASLEHLTAILARRVLTDPERRTANMHPEMARLWRWHALEEAEHKSVAFDVLKRISPGRARRAIVMALNTLGLGIEVFDRLVYMLWKDGLLFKVSTWSNGWRFLFGRDGFLRDTGADYLSWYRRDFDPRQIDDRPLIEKHAPLVEVEIMR